MAHEKPCPAIEDSRRLLVSYLNSLMIIKQSPVVDVAKGKMVVNANSFLVGSKGLRKQNHKRMVDSAVNR
jgi:hypothetical protein